MRAPRNSRLALIKRRHKRDLRFTAFAAMMVNSDIDCVMGMEPTDVGHLTASRIPLPEAADPVTVVPLTKLREWRPRIRTSAMRNQPPIGALEGKRAPVKLSDDEKHSRWLDCMQRIADAPPPPPAKPRRQMPSRLKPGELAKHSTKPPAGASDNVPRSTVDAVLADWNEGPSQPTNAEMVGALEAIQRTEGTGVAILDIRGIKVSIEACRAAWARVLAAKSKRVDEERRQAAQRMVLGPIDDGDEAGARDAE